MKYTGNIEIDVNSRMMEKLASNGGLQHLRAMGIGALGGGLAGIASNYLKNDPEERNPLEAGVMGALYGSAGGALGNYMNPALGDLTAAALSIPFGAARGYASQTPSENKAEIAQACAMYQQMLKDPNLSPEERADIENDLAFWSKGLKQ